LRNQNNLPEQVNEILSLQDLLNATGHRPWATPIESWKYYQEWNNVVFLHWEVDLEILKQLIPDNLEIDLYDGAPWVSIVAFTMEKIRPRHLPSIGFVSNFDELNIRTYVKYGGKTGVYFLSIEAGSSLSCRLAELMSGLPYRYSKIERSEKQFRSFNLKNNDTFKIDFSIGKMIENKNTLDNWLTERYALFQNAKENINQFEIHHLEWPLHDLSIHKLEMNNSKFDSLIDCIPYRMHYSPGVKVLAWGKQKTKAYNLKYKPN
jgi:uncharacterized protein YqjF (DUF2071 family)